MAKMKIELPEKFLFSTQIPIRISDINYGHHLGHDALISILHEARVQFLRHLGYKDEADVGGTSLILTDLSISYRSEGFYGDFLKVEVGVGSISPMRFDLVYKVINQTSGKDLAYAQTTLGCFDYRERKIQPIPQNFKSKLGVPNTSLNK